jgi:hypothetical protein
MGVALVHDEGEPTDPLVGLAQLDPSRAARLTSFSRARFTSLASVGKVMFFGCTVVSTMTRLRSDGLMAPARVATARLSCSKASKRSSPMRLRQRVIEERSSGRLCRKNSSPQKY